MRRHADAWTILVVLVVSLAAACRAEPEPRPEPAQLRPASEPQTRRPTPAPAPPPTAFAPEEIDPASFPDPVFNRATPPLSGALPGDDAPIDLPEAPPGWPRWEDDNNRPPVSMAAKARELMASYERGLTPVASWGDIPFASTLRMLHYDRFIFHVEARAWAPHDLRLRYVEKRWSDSAVTSPVIERTWSVDLDGGVVQLRVVEATKHMAIHIRPHEWLDASLDDRLAWTRKQLPRLIRLRGFDEALHRRSDVDLRWTREGPDAASVATATWSPSCLNWYEKIYGFIDGDGVSLLVRRRHRYGDQRFGP